MKRTLLVAATALALSAPAVPHAHAEYALHTPGQWIDTRHHLVLNDLPDSSEYVAHWSYARTVCHVKTGATVSEQPTPGYAECMKAEGVAFVPDSPAQIVARQKRRGTRRTAPSASPSDRLSAASRMT